MRSFRVWSPLLALLLLFAALALPVHGVGHAFGHVDGDAPAETAATCVECLSLNGAQPLPVDPPALPSVTYGIAAPVFQRAMPVAAPRRFYFQSRAPPRLLPAPFR